MFRFIFILIAFLLKAPDSFSQFNDSVHHHFSFMSGGIFNKTKEVSSFVLNNGAGFEINQKKISFNAAANWVYGKQQQKLSNNDISVYTDVDFLQNVRPLYYWALAGFDESYSLKINYRFQSGIGIGYTLVKQPNGNLIISDGFVYETSDLTDPLLGKDVYQTVRNSFRIKYRWVYKKIITIEGSQFIQPSLISLKDYILKSSNTLSVRLNSWLAINATAGYNKINRTHRENLLITYGLSVNKYF